MKKLAKITGIFLLLVTVCYSGFPAEPSIFPNSRYGFSSDGSMSDLGRKPKGPEVIHPRTTFDLGGVIFQETAVAAENAVGQKVTMQYNPLQADGWRLSLTIGNTEVSPELYDWEIIPIARFVDSGLTACMTLFDKPRTDDELVTHLRNRAMGIRWANFHPAFGNTLIGLNLFFVDAMLINPDLMQFVDESFTEQIPGYHTTQGIISRELRQQNKDGISLLLGLYTLLGTYNSYIYTDYGTKISYSIENGQIVFSGVPSYLFIYNNRGEGTATVATEMNGEIIALQKNVNAINPTVYRSAERTAQWAAFFRMVQTDYPEIWQEFMGQIAEVEASPKVETPRYWLSRSRLD